MTIGARVKKRREFLRLTQQELGDKTDMPQTIISRIERGLNENPGADVLKRLAVALHVSIDWLVGMYEDDPPRLLAVAEGVA